MIKAFRYLRQNLLLQGRFSKYLTYAIGEIILVVIGILLALELNAWNERQNQNEARTGYVRALLADLEMDSTQLVAENSSLRLRLDELASIKRRLSGQQATEDTLDQVIKKEFNPSFVGNRPINRNNFETLISTGDLGFFEPADAEAIQNYYQAAGYVESVHDTQLEFYKKVFADYLTGVPNSDIPYEKQFSLIEDGPLKELLWRDTDMKKAHALFSGLTSIQLHIFMTFERINRQLLEENQRLRRHLKALLAP